MTGEAMATRLIRLALLTALLCACAPLPPPLPEAPKPSAPQVSEAQLREKAWLNFATGLRQYEAGSYDDAAKSLTAALDHGLLPRPEQAVARKHLAFIHCVAGRDQQCREEFRKAMEIDPTFELTTAEAGHPIWGPVYSNVRAQMIAAVPRAFPVTTAPRPKAEQMLFDGLEKYDAGDFDAALVLLQGAYKEGLAAKADQIKALKHIAFCLCLANKPTACRNEFNRIFEVDADFELAPAEAGHPAWTKIYAAARQRAREAHDKTAKDTPKNK
jgi:tetratricopeptide (TPR) repeat protein